MLILLQKLLPLLLSLFFFASYLSVVLLSLLCILLLLCPFLVLCARMLSSLFVVMIHSIFDMEAFTEKQLQ